MGLNLNFEIFYSNFDFSSPTSKGDHCHFPTFSRHTAIVIIFPNLLFFYNSVTFESYVSIAEINK